MARKTLREKFIDLLEVDKIKEEKQDGYIQLRLKGIGFHNPCSRCGGSGIYTQYHGRCYKCGGRGNDPVKLTTVNYNEAVKLVEAGKLKEYFETVRLKQKMERMDDILFKLTHTNELASDYTNELRKEKREIQPNGEWGFTYRLNGIIKELRFKQCAIYDDFIKEKKSLLAKKGTEADRNLTMAYIEHRYEEEKEKMIKLNKDYEQMKQMFMGMGEDSL